MTYSLRSFVLLGWPALAVLVGGLVPLLRTGQVDLRGWALVALLLVPAAALLKVRRGVGAVWWASLGAVATVLCFACLATFRAPGYAAALGFIGLASLATLVGLLLSGSAPAKTGGRIWGGLGLVLLAVAAWWQAQAPRIEPFAGARPPLAVISSLPLFWKAVETGPATRADAPIVTVLRQRFDVRPVDSPLSLAKMEAARLLLAQPRALSPGELVALDQWVRQGGQALVLADPQLHWPMALPMGDRRRPPAVTLLAGLLDHWGVSLAPVEAGGGERRHILDDGRLVTLYAASSFRATGPACRILDQGVVARCKVGKGTVIIVADADFIDDRLWLADPEAPLDTGEWSADTPQLVVEALGGGVAGTRRWVGSGSDLVSAVRWAILVGMIWAMLGAMLFRCGRQRRPALRQAPSGPGRRQKTG